MSLYYPPVGFYFDVKIAGASGEHDSAFSEASGLEAERGVIEIPEGGENRYTHRLPDRGRYGNLVLKRGVMVASSIVFDWCRKSLESDLSKSIETKDVDVSLLDERGSPLITWNFKNAWPVKWSVGALDAKESEVAVETLELSYAFMTRKQVRKTGTTGMLEG